MGGRTAGVLVEEPAGLRLPAAQALGPDAIGTSPQGYGLRWPQTRWTPPVQPFVGRARELLTLGESEPHGTSRVEALELWRGRPWGLEPSEPGGSEAERLEEVRREVEEVAVEAALAAADTSRSWPQTAAMVKEAPLRERRWALLALAQYQAGRQMEALRTVRRIQGVLRQELGTRTGTGAGRLRGGHPAAGPRLAVEVARTSARRASRRTAGWRPSTSRTPSPSSAARPRPGVASPGSARLIFGDRRTVRERKVLARCAPGSPRRYGWRAATGRRHPWSTSLDALTSAGPRTARCWWWTRPRRRSRCARTIPSGRFFAGLVGQTARGRVVLALRADHTGDVAATPALAALVERGLFLLGPMSAESLRVAMESRPPARSGARAGTHRSPAPGDRGRGRSPPPALHALRETWLRHEGRTLTVAGYQASGGVRGAVAQSAEALYGGLGEDERTLLRDLVLRLVFPGPGGEPLRGEVPRHQLVADPTQDRIIGLMVTAAWSPVTPT